MKIAEGILPAGWIGLSLEDVAEIHDNLREPVNSSERAKRPGTYPYYGATGQVGWIDNFRQDGEYVLLGEDGAPFFEPTKEKAYLVSGKCWVNNHAHVLKGREGLCSNRYLLYALNQTNYRGYANGTTRLKLTQSAMRQLPINLAPFNEQHRIVAKIEELFSERDKGIENLKTARAQLKVYRQALLKHAFEGKLTAQWRAERSVTPCHPREAEKKSVIPAKAGIHSNEKLDSRLRGNDEMGGGNDEPLETADTLLKRIQQERAQRYQQQLADWEKSKSPSIPLLQRGKTTSAAAHSTVPHFEKGGLGGICRGISKPKAPKPLPPLTAAELAELPELPEGWGWVKYGELTESSQNGISKRSAETGTEYIVLRLADITEQKISLSNTRKILLTDNEINNYRLQKNELICIRVNGSADLVGRVVSIKEDLGIAYCDHFIRFKLFNNIASPSYVQNFFNTQGVRRYVELNKVSSAGQNTVNQEMLSAVKVAICSLEEQKKIVEILEEKLSEVDQLDQTITTSLQQAEALRQSILKKAFSGQLVPQDPHDEPASKLLARIRAERAVVAKSATTAAKPRKTAGRK